MAYKIYTSDNVSFTVDYGNGNLVTYKKAEVYVQQTGDYVYIKKASNDSVILAVKYGQVSIPVVINNDELYSALYYICGCIRPDYGNILNTPDISGFVPGTRTITINGNTQDLSANRSWTLATGGDMLGANNLSDVASADTSLTNLGGTTVGKNIFKAVNPSAVRLIQVNADNTVTFIDITGSLGKAVYSNAPLFDQVIKLGSNGGLTGAIWIYGTTAGRLTLTTPDNTSSYTLTFPANNGGGVATWLRNAAGDGILDWRTAAQTRADIGAGTGNGDALTTNPLSQFAATTSAELAGVISDETGTGVLVFNIAPVLKNPTIVDTTTPTKVIAFDNTGMTAGVTLTLASVQTASRTLTIPAVGSGDTIATLLTTQTFGGSKTFKDSVFLLRNPADTFSYTIATAAITADRTINMPLTRQTETLAVQPQVYQATPGDPTGTTSTTGVMMGLAGAITPQVTGRVHIMITGDIQNSTGDDGAKVRLRYGTGGAPANGAVITGTVIGGRVTMNAVTSGSATATVTVPFTVSGIVTGLTAGTAIWIDVDVAATTAGTASIKNLSVTAFEL